MVRSAADPAELQVSTCFDHHVEDEVRRVAKPDSFSLVDMAIAFANALRFRPLTTAALRRFLAHLLPDTCND